MKQLRKLQREEPKTAPEGEEESEVGSLPKIRFQLGIWGFYVGFRVCQRLVCMGSDLGFRGLRTSSL